MFGKHPIAALVSIVIVSGAASSNAAEQNKFPQAPASHWAFSLPNQPYLSLIQQSAWLLADPIVEAQLKLSPDQLKMIRKDFQVHGAAQKALFGQRGASQSQIAQIDKNLASQVLASLTNGQEDRLRQIGLQIRGLPALSDDGVAKDLGLSPHQKAEIKRIFASADLREADFDEALANKVLKVPPMADKKAYEARRSAIVLASQPEEDRIQKQRKLDESKALAVLTQAQQEKWARLMGAPLKKPTMVVRPLAVRKREPVTLKSGHT